MDVDGLIDNLVPDANIQAINSILFIQSMCFAFIPYNSNYYIFDSHSCGSLGQSRENCYSILLQFVTTEHALDFITTTNLVNNQLQHVCEKQFFFLNLKVCCM